MGKKLKDRVLRWEREVMSVETISASKPDPAWRFTDAFGHEHRFVGDLIPTTIEVAEGTYWCFDCNDEHTDYVLKCKQCDETVEQPHYLPDPGPHLIPGLIHYFLDDKPISAEHYERLLAEMTP